MRRPTNRFRIVRVKAAPDPELIITIKLNRASLAAPGSGAPMGASAHRCLPGPKCGGGSADLLSNPDSIKSDY